MVALTADQLLPSTGFRFVSDVYLAPLFWLKYSRREVSVDRGVKKRSLGLSKACSEHKGIISIFNFEIISVSRAREGCSLEQVLISLLFKSYCLRFFPCTIVLSHHKINARWIFHPSHVPKSVTNYLSMRSPLHLKHSITSYNWIENGYKLEKEKDTREKCDVK